MCALPGPFGQSLDVPHMPLWPGNGLSQRDAGGHGHIPELSAVTSQVGREDVGRASAMPTPPLHYTASCCLIGGSV